MPRRTTSLQFAAVGALGFLIYLPSLAGGFLWDDASLFAGGWLAKPDALATIWLRPAEIRTEEHYWPVVYSLFYLQHLLWGAEAAGYRLVNMMLHAGNGMLLLALLRQLRVPWAFPAAALFAVHPVHVESVAWIIELKDLLSGFFMLATALSFGVAMREERTNRARAVWLVMAMAMFVLALGSKSVAVVTPMALAILCWWQGTLTRHAALALVPFFAIAALYTVVDLRFMVGVGNPSVDMGLLQRIEVAGRAFWFYAAQSLWPAKLTPLYPKWVPASSTAGALAPMALAAAVMVALAGLARRIGRGPITLMLLFAVTLLPTLGLVPFTFQQYAFVADRYLYLAVACPAVAVAVGAARIHDLVSASALRLVPAATIATLTMILAALTLKHIPVYQDNESWARTVLARNPEAVVAHQILGVSLLARGDWAGALPHLREVARCWPDNASAHYNLAVAHAKAGQRDEALACLDRALAADPSHRNSLALRDRLTTATTPP